MKEYIRRLIECGYTKDEAYQICKDFLRNLHIFDLQFFVESVERRNHVG
jgi:hypothetical protein